MPVKLADGHNAIEGTAHIGLVCKNSSVNQDYILLPVYVQLELRPCSTTYASADTQAGIIHEEGQPLFTTS